LKYIRIHPEYTLNMYSGGRGKNTYPEDSEIHWKYVERYIFSYCKGIPQGAAMDDDGTSAMAPVEMHGDDDDDGGGGGDSDDDAETAMAMAMAIMAMAVRL
jgi:hypothetical protein